jgi:hypothetical protein
MREPISSRRSRFPTIAKTRTHGLGRERRTPPAFEPAESGPWIGVATWTASAFIGLRLWKRGVLYYNPELLQGFGLRDTTGAAGVPNGEAQKSNFPYPRYSTSRLFLRQTVKFGGEQETVDSVYGQMAAKRDVSRLTFRSGRRSRPLLLVEGNDTLMKSLR